VDGSLQKVECAGKPIVEGDQKRCGFDGVPVTVSVAGQAGSEKTTMTQRFYEGYGYYSETCSLGGYSALVAMSKGLTKKK